jgi:hypothetical protein
MMRKVNLRFVWLKEDSVNISHSIPCMFVSLSNACYGTNKTFLWTKIVYFLSKSPSKYIMNQMDSINTISHDMWQNYSGDPRVIILQDDWHFTFDRQKINDNLSSARHVSGIRFIRYAQIRNTGKPNNLSVGSNKTKGPKQDSQNRLKSPVPAEGEP